MATRQQEFLEALTSGHAQAWDGRWVLAAESYRRALALFPQDRSAQVFTAMALARLGNSAEAVSLLKGAAAGSRIDHLLLSRAAIVAKASGRLDEATDYKMQAAEKLWAKERRQDALRIWTSIASEQPGFPAIHERLALAYREVGDLDAVAEHEAILRGHAPAPTTLVEQVRPSDTSVLPREAPRPAQPSEQELDGTLVASATPASSPLERVTTHASEEFVEEAIVEVPGEDRSDDVLAAPVATGAETEDRIRAGEPSTFDYAEAPDLGADEDSELTPTVAMAADISLVSQETQDIESPVAFAPGEPESVGELPDVTFTAELPTVESPEPSRPSEYAATAETELTREFGPGDLDESVPLVSGEQDLPSSEPPVATSELPLSEVISELEPVSTVDDSRDTAQQPTDTLGDEAAETEREVAVTPSEAAQPADEAEQVPAARPNETADAEPLRRPWWRGLLRGQDAESPQPAEELARAAADAVLQPSAANEVEPAQTALEPGIPGESVEPAKLEAVEVVEPIESESTAEGIEPEAERAVEDVDRAADVEREDAVVESDRDLLAEWRQAAYLLRVGHVTEAIDVQDEILETVLGDDLTVTPIALERIASVVAALDSYALTELQSIPGFEGKFALRALARGAAFAEAGLVAAATEIYEETIARLPEFVPAQVALAQLLSSAGKSSQAREKFTAIAAVCDIRGQSEFAEKLRLLARAS